MNYRKTAILLAFALCVLLLLPLATSFADASESPSAEPETIQATCSAIPEGTDDTGTEAESAAEAEEETEHETAVILQQGDTTLFDLAGNSIGTLRVDPKDGLYAYLLNGSDTEEGAFVVFTLPSNPTEEWFRSTTEANKAPANLLMVSVRYGENYTNTQPGWVDATQVRNLTVILNSATYDQIHEEIETLRGEVQRSMQTPANTPLPSVTPLNGGERMQIQELVKNPTSVFLILVLIFAFLIIVLVVLTSNQKKVVKKLPSAHERKAEFKECLEKSLLPTISDSTSSIEKKVDEQKKDHLAMDAKVDAISRQASEKEKPAVKDWDQLIEIAKAEMNQTYFEEWKKAFLSKGWIPQGIRTPELNIPGEFEIAEFNMSSDFAAFPVHDPEVKGVLYVIPSHANRDLRSGRLKDLFYVREGEVDASEFYRMIKPAILHSTNDRFYTVQSKGEIQVRIHE
ncbi:MAG: hypothetical protein ABFC31_10920 [Clostridiaceae bacterium]